MTWIQIVVEYLGVIDLYTCVTQKFLVKLTFFFFFQNREKNNLYLDFRFEKFIIRKK
jgi:hypothetical protein